LIGQRVGRHVRRLRLVGRVRFAFGLPRLFFAFHRQVQQIGQFGLAFRLDAERVAGGRRVLRGAGEE
jgi:hypothetical protein